MFVVTIIFIPAPAISQLLFRSLLCALSMAMPLLAKAMVPVLPQSFKCWQIRKHFLGFHVE